MPFGILVGRTQSDPFVLRSGDEIIKWKVSDVTDMHWSKLGRIEMCRERNESGEAMTVDQKCIGTVRCLWFKNYHVLPITIEHSAECRTM